MKAEARIGDHQYITSLLARIEELEKPLVDKAMALALLNTKVKSSIISPEASDAFFIATIRLDCSEAFESKII